MAQFLQAIWISSQGRIEGFPGSHDITGDVSDESLEYLLQFDPITDGEFWRALGSSVTVEQLSRLSVKGVPENLQNLVNGNLDRLWARQMLIKTGQLNFEEVPDGLHWGVTQRALTLFGAEFRAYFAQSTAELKHIRHDRAYGMSFMELRSRSRSARLTEVTLQMPHEEVTFRASGPFGVLETEGLSALGSYKEQGVVVKATAKTLGGQEVHCDFLSVDATAVTSTKVSLEDWKISILPLMTDLEMASDLGPRTSDMRFEPDDPGIQISPIESEDQEN